MSKPGNGKSGLREPVDPPNPPYWRARNVPLDELEETLNKWVEEGWHVEEYIDLNDVDMFGQRSFFVIAWNVAAYGELKGPDSLYEDLADPEE